MKKVSLADFPFINKVVEEVKVLKEEIPVLESTLEKLFNHGKPLTLKIEGVLEESKPKSKFGESPFSSTPDEDKGVMVMHIPGMGQMVMSNPFPSPKEVDVESSLPSIIEEVVGEQILYKVIGLLLEEKKGRLVNCINKLLEYGIIVEG